MNTMGVLTLSIGIPLLYGFIAVAAFRISEDILRKLGHDEDCAIGLAIWWPFVVLYFILLRPFGRGIWQSTNWLVELGGKIAQVKRDNK